MRYFLTSSLCLPDRPELNPANGLVEELRKVIVRPVRTLFICSDPVNTERTERHSAAIRESFEAAGLAFTAWDILDGRNETAAPALVGSADLIILAGGHVPTQNSFFQRIGLRALLRNWPGILVGISAGTMNSADTVYAQPELPGEAVSPEYQRFLPGLGITDTMVLPHYQMVKDDVLDGLRLFEDVTYPDSAGQSFYALPDGSWLLGADGEEELRGEAYLIRNGELRALTRDGESLTLHRAPFHIRPAVPADAEALLEIHNWYIQNTAVNFSYEPLTQGEFAHRMEHLGQRWPFLTAEAEGRVLGYAHAGPFVGRAAYDWSAEVTIYLHPEARRKGVGRGLYTALEDRLKTMGIRSLYACIGMPEREDEVLTLDSVRFHRAMGYRAVGEFKNCAYKFGSWLHMVWMEKLIGDHTHPPDPVVPFGKITR